MPEENEKARKRDRHAAPVGDDCATVGGYSSDDVGFFFGALASARDQFGEVTKELARHYGIGPRGPWIVGMMGRQAVSPNELAKFCRVGRSLITAELQHLHEAALINYARNENDGRRIKLSLTPLGEELLERLTANLTRMLTDRLSQYAPQEVMACARMLSDFAQGNQYAPLAGGT